MLELRDMLRQVLGRDVTALRDTDTPTAVAAILTGQPDHISDYAVLAVTAAWDIALGRAVPAKRPAGSPLPDPRPVTDMTNSLATSRGTQKFRGRAPTMIRSRVPFHSERCGRRISRFGKSGQSQISGSAGKRVPAYGTMAGFPAFHVRGACVVRCGGPSRELTTGARRSCAVPEAVHLDWCPRAGGQVGSRRGKRPTSF